MPLVNIARNAEEAAEMAVVLNRLFDASVALQTPVDALQFRVDNEDLIPTIDRLEQTPFLRREGDEYRLGMATLFELQDERAKSLLLNCDRILNLLRTHYRNKNTRKAPKELLEISRELNLSIEQVLFCVDVLKEVSWGWGGWNNPPAPISERVVIPNESILRYKSLREIYAYLNKQVEAH